MKFKKNLRHTITVIVILLGVLCTAYSVWAYPEVFKADILENKTFNVGLDEPIAIDFSVPMMVGGYSGKIKIFPAENFKFHWENNNRKLVIVPKNLWSPGTNYKITLPPGRSMMLTGMEGKNISFYTIKYPEVKETFPAVDAKDVILDIEDPITVNFNNSTEKFKIKFELNPVEEVTYQSDSSNTQFKILPKNNIKDGTEYFLSVYASFGENNKNEYRKIYETNFFTHSIISLANEKDLSIRTARAKNETAAKIAQGKYIDINLSAQVLSTFENGKIIDSYIISSGKKGLDTPKGQFKIYNKTPRAWSKAYGLFMPFWMAFMSDGSRGIHELPEWPGGYKEGANHLGIPVSHGCVRLGIGSAKSVYDWADIGTPVVIY